MKTTVPLPSIWIPAKFADKNLHILNSVDKITMYGDGNSTKLMKDIMGTVVQVTDGLKESTGVDLQAVLSGFLAGKVESGDNKGDANKPFTE